MIRMILKNVGSNQVSKWDKELVASAKYCICGLRIADFKNMPNALVERSWKSLVSAVKKCGRRQMEIVCMPLLLTSLKSRYYQVEYGV